MRCVFGPVQSRRLGRSLGIDIIPHKTCNWNCAYCQLGRTAPVTNTRLEYYPTDVLAFEIRRALRTIGGEIDWITFVGSGEPTLHSRIGKLIRDVKELTDTPVAVITNGSLLQLATVAEDLRVADAVLPSLDAGSDLLYRMINRPHPQVSYDLYRRGLIEFRQTYGGKLWIEVMLVAGLNDDERALAELSIALREISPDEVHISTPFRVPAEAWVRGPSNESIALANTLFGEKTRVLIPAVGYASFGHDDPVEEIVEVLFRHPMSDQELRSTLMRSVEDVELGLRRLSQDGRVQQVLRDGTLYWCPAPGHYLFSKDDREKCSRS